jgi:hypothetical protein
MRQLCETLQGRPDKCGLWITGAGEPYPSRGSRRDCDPWRVRHSRSQPYAFQAKPSFTHPSTVILSEVRHWRSECLTQSKDPVFANTTSASQGILSRDVGRMPNRVTDDSRSAGVLRLRSRIREANRAAPLRMTECCDSLKWTQSSSVYLLGLLGRKLEREPASVAL